MKPVTKKNRHHLLHANGGAVAGGAFLLAAVFVPSQVAAVCKAGSPNAYLPEATPTSGFVVHNNGTVTHALTGLTWDRCPLGMTLDDNGTPQVLADDRCLGTPVDLDWQQTLEEAVAANRRGHLGNDDWRVPNLRELLSIVESCGANPAVNIEVFPVAGTRRLAEPFWTSTTFLDNPQNPGSPQAWAVSFRDGGNYGELKQDPHLVRLVRGGVPAYPGGKPIDAFDGLREQTGASAVVPSGAVTYGETLSFSVLVTGDNPTGRVQFRVDGRIVNCEGGEPSLDASGKAVCQPTTPVSAGVHQLVAVYEGDRVNLPAYSPQSAFTIEKADQNLTGFMASPSVGLVGSYAVLSVEKQGGSSSPVVYSSTTPAVCTISGSSRMNFHAVGNCTVTADQAGDENYNPAAAVTIDIEVVTGDADGDGVADVVDKDRCVVGQLMLGNLYAGPGDSRLSSETEIVTDPARIFEVRAPHELVIRAPRTVVQGGTVVRVEKGATVSVAPMNGSCPL